MTLLFVASAAFVFYAYFGYPLVLMLLKRRPTDKCVIDSLPTVSILMCVHNAESLVQSKLRNLNGLDYPGELLEIVVVCDGCTDETARVLREHESAVPVRVVESERHIGKAACLNEAARLAKGTICLMVDVRQRIEPQSLKSLVSHFDDSNVGAVSGELTFVDENDPGKPVGVGVYWRFEKLVRKLESLTGSVIGATGAIYAVRRSLIPTLPANLILDDVFIPMNVVKARKRVLFESSAIAKDNIVNDHSAEFARKVRTLYGNLQLVELAPWLIGPRNPALVRFCSHKLARIAVPIPLLLMLISSFFSTWPPLRALFWIQLTFYGLAVLSPLLVVTSWLSRISALARTFVLLNSASVVAICRYLARKPAVWKVTTIGSSPRPTDDEVAHA